MPFYTWVDKKTGKQVEVLRAFKDYEQKPTEEESAGTEEADWERQVGSNQILTRGPNWSGRKGEW